MDAQTYSAVAVGAATLIIAGSRLADGETPSVRVFIGGTVAAFTLSVAAGFLPGAARALATLTIIGALLSGGYSLIQRLAGLAT